MISLLSNLLKSATFAGVIALPAWISTGPTMDSQYHYVVCSHDGLDPENVKQLAESKCLASAAKLAGVTVKITQKTIQSLTGADSSEVAEIQPLERNVLCEWTDRYLERVNEGFRVWLRCRIKKSSLVSSSKQLIPESQTESSSSISSSSLKRYQRGILILTTVPKVDRILVVGDGGERVIEVKSNVIRVELHEGDTKIIARKHKYKDASFELQSWKHGDSVSQTLYLEQEI